MSDSQTKGWYELVLPDDDSLVNVCYADNAFKAIERFGSLAKGVKVSRLIWGRLSKLTGCVIPFTRKPEDFACERLQFYRRGCLVSIWPSVT